MHSHGHMQSLENICLTHVLFWQHFNPRDIHPKPYITTFDVEQFVFTPAVGSNANCKFENRCWKRCVFTTTLAPKTICASDNACLTWRVPTPPFGQKARRKFEHRNWTSHVFTTIRFQKQCVTLKIDVGMGVCSQMFGFHKQPVLLNVHVGHFVCSHNSWIQKQFVN